MAKYNEVMENIKVTDEMRSRILRNVALSLEAGNETESEAEDITEDVTETETEYAAEKEAEKIAEFRKTKKRFNGAWIPPVALTAAAAVILVIVRPWSGSSLMSSKSAMSDTAMSTDSVAEAAYDDYYDYEDAVVTTETETTNEAETDSYMYPEDLEDEDVWSGDGMRFDAKEYGSAREMSDAVGFEIKDITVVPFEADEVIYRVISGTLAEIMYIGGEEELTLRKSAGSDDNSGDYNEYTIAEALEIGDEKINILGYEEGFYLATWFDGEYYYSIRSDNPITSETMEEIVANVITGN